MLRGISAGLIALGLFAAVANAGLGDFSGTWTPEGEGSLKGPIGPGDEDISRVVITPQGVNAVRVHLYGRCKPECDWGSALAHPHFEGPGSDALRSLRAEFQTPSAIKHLTLRAGAGRGLRFELLTDFTDHSGRHDYETSGSLRPAPDAAPSPTLSAGPAAGAQISAEIAEDCERINPATVFMAPGANGGWVVRDYDHVITDFGSDKEAAAKAVPVLKYYRFDEQCYIARPKAKMVYWRVSGQFPRDLLRAADCVEIEPSAISVRDGRVMSAAREILDFGADGASAAKAAAVLRANRVTRQCFAAKPSMKMIYWLSQ